MLTSQIGLRTTDLKKKQPPSFSLLSHSRFTSPPTLSSLSFPPFFPPTQTALSLKDPWVTDTALEFWELWHKDTACSPNSRRSEGVERGKKLPGCFWLGRAWRSSSGRVYLLGSGSQPTLLVCCGLQGGWILHPQSATDLSLTVSYLQGFREREEEKWREKERRRESNNYL